MLKEYHKGKYETRLPTKRFLWHSPTRIRLCLHSEAARQRTCNGPAREIPPSTVPHGQPPVPLLHAPGPAGTPQSK